MGVDQGLGPQQLPRARMPATATGKWRRSHQVQSTLLAGTTGPGRVLYTPGPDSGAHSVVGALKL